ncbi:hypothetical protein Bca52824_077622 [Brassica carinata]|uniref:Uncharacterized protein n=1 Tax=Brassica carinata TaxID=52824 RepID=A0A8X7PW70_BRACI|nr:hypothetical protein Bca52824_077622 [Brassica carinata]
MIAVGILCYNTLYKNVLVNSSNSISIFSDFVLRIHLDHVNMGQDYDSDQPSSSDATSPPFLKKKLHFIADEAESSYMVAEPAQYPPPAEAVTQLGTQTQQTLWLWRR